MQEINRVRDKLGVRISPTPFYGENMTAINWEVIDEYENKYGIKSKHIYYTMIDNLIDMGILCLEQKGNYVLTSCGVDLNPRKSLFIVYFSEKEYAEEYKEQVLSDAKYDIDIIQF